MKTLCIIALAFLNTATYAQQALTLAECYRLAQANYPLSNRKELVRLSKEYTLENASRAFLPRVSLAGQATYQSDVTQLPVEMPGVEPLSKDQYRATLDVSQTLYQGGLVGRQKALEELNATVEEVGLDVDLYKVRNRVNDLFFGILLLDEQSRLSELVRRNLEVSLKEVQAAITNGVAVRSAGDALEAEILKVDQRIIEVQASLHAYQKMLGLLIGQQLGDNTELEKPVFEDAPKDAALNRPELDLFRAQRNLLVAREGLLSAMKKPRVELFAQAGYGRPGLNMLLNEFDMFYITGLRFSWLLSGYYTARRESEILRIGQQSIQVQEDAFRFNTTLELANERADIAKLRRVIELDRQLISLRAKVRETARVQLREGVITPTHFIQEANAEDQAKQNLAMHETQLLQAQARYHFTSGY